MPKNPADRIASAQSAFEAGFASKAAQKRALDDLNRAFKSVRDGLMTAILVARTDVDEEKNREDYWSIPFELHHIRDKHLEIAARYSEEFAIVRDLIALRAAIKSAEIAPPPAKPEIEVKAEKVRRSILEEMESRKAQFIEGLEVTRLFNGLPVSANAHMVHGHKGAVFVRHFFYLNGKITALNMILAIAEAHEAEKESES